MAGLSCQNCCFVLYNGKSQDGCMLGRLDKYENVDVLNEEVGGTYKVLTKNICTAKRRKDWLAKLEPGVKPEYAVRIELFPKVQLIAIISDEDKDHPAWLEYLDKCNDYSAVDVLYDGPISRMLENYGSLTNKKQNYLHAITRATTLHNHINYVFRNDCQYYVLVDNLNDDFVNIPEILDIHLNDRCQQIALVDSPNMIISSILHESLLGFGQQTIYEKIEIFCKNNNCEHMLLNHDQFWDITDE